MQAEMNGKESGDVRKSETGQPGVGTQTPREGSIPSPVRPHSHTAYSKITQALAKIVMLAEDDNERIRREPVMAEVQHIRDAADQLERELAEAKKRGDAYAEKFNAECNRSDLILRRAMNAEAALSEKAATQQPSAPCVARQTLTSSRWSADGELIWWIEGEEISDSDLRKWCANNMAGPNRYVDVIRECHVRAYSQRERPE